MKMKNRMKKLEKRQEAFREKIAPKLGSIYPTGSFTRPGSLKK